MYIKLLANISVLQDSLISEDEKSSECVRCVCEVFVHYIHSVISLDHHAWLGQYHTYASN